MSWHHFGQIKFNPFSPRLQNWAELFVGVSVMKRIKTIKHRCQYFFPTLLYLIILSFGGKLCFDFYLTVF